MPNRFSCTTFSTDPNSLPLCTPSTGCAFYYNISGNTHQDTSATCTTDSLNNGSAISNVKLQLSNNGQVQQQTYAYGYGYGQYSFKTGSIATYSVTVDTSNIPFSIVCPNSQNRIAAETITDSVFTNQDFGLQCKGVDNGVSDIQGRFRLGRSHTVQINAGDIARPYGATCSNHSSGMVHLFINGPAQYAGHPAGSLAPFVYSSHNAAYNVSDFDNINPGDFDIIVFTDSTATVGNTVCITATVQTYGGVDINPTNDSLTQCFTVVNSYDPNLKSVYPIATVDTGAQWLTYTIDFQNTGNDTAYTVVVRDTLSQYVDASSFQYLASSHKAVIQLFGNAMVFTFPKINLVDSLHNEPLSHGWLQYKVKTKPHLPLTTQIRNTAYIYFDLNPAVVTNTTTNTVALPTGISETAAVVFDAQLYPNPATQSCIIRIANGGSERYTASLLDMSGREVSYLGELKNGMQSFAVSSFAKGIYTLRVTDGKGRSIMRKLVVE